MKKLIIIFLVLSVYSCKTQQNAMQTTKIDNAIELNAKKIYSVGEKINISLKNISENPITIYRPREKFFYKKSEDGQWKKISIFYCPCDASCPPPPEETALNPNSIQTITWDQKEDSCGEKRVNGVRETIEKQVAAGSYRVEISYAISGERKKYYYEFQIK